MSFLKTNIKQRGGGHGCDRTASKVKLRCTKKETLVASWNAVVGLARECAQLDSWHRALRRPAANVEFYAATREGLVL
jgi:hypothetical protein